MYACVPVLTVLLATTSGAGQNPPPSIEGRWRLNTELSDTTDRAGDAAERDGREGGRGRGGLGRGGRGGGPGGGRGGRGPGARGNQEDAQRRRDAVREITAIADRLTIVMTPSMVIVTTGEGRITRLAPDGSKVKDESTGVERRTRWDGTRLVSEISGLPGSSLTESYTLDGDSRRLVVTLAPTHDTRGGPSPRRLVYDLVSD